jgi:hypothetical protein
MPASAGRRERDLSFSLSSTRGHPSPALGQLQTSHIGQIETQTHALIAFLAAAAGGWTDRVNCHFRERDPL